MPEIHGAFDITTIPQPAEADAVFATVSRLLLDKHFHGPLEAVSHGQMLAIGGEAGWGVYVALEVVEGMLDGRQGSFVLHHNGTMTPQTGQHLVVAVAPDSGTGELVGLSGMMRIEITAGRHAYAFTYELPPE